MGSLIALACIVAPEDARADPPVALSLQMAPRVVAAAEGPPLSLELLAGMLAKRLAPAAVAVVTGDAPAGTATWVLELSAPERTMQIRLTDPEGRLLVARRIPLARRRAHTIAHTITLSVLEGMASVLDRLLALVPEPALPETEEEPPPPSPAPAAAPTVENDRRLEIGLQLHGAMVHPGRGALGGLGLAATLPVWRMAVVDLTVAGWTPRSETGADYRVRAQYGTASLLAMAEVPLGAWTARAGLGGAVRAVRVRYGGAAVVEDEDSHVNGGFVARAAGKSPPLGWIRLAAGIDAARYYPYQRFTVAGQPVLNTGRLTVAAWLALSWQP